MKQKICNAIALLLASLCCASTAWAQLHVVATTPDLGALAQTVGGSAVEVTTLAKPTEDPHFVDAKPSFIVKLNRADVLIEGGAELEVGWLPALLDQARNEKLAAGAPGRVSCARAVTLLNVPATLDRSQGDVHASGNPHYLIDPVNARQVAAAITTAFCALDAKSCQQFQANNQSFAAQLDGKVAEWTALLAPYRGVRVVAYHDSWLYFAKRFGLTIDLTLEPKPGIPPTPAHLAEVVETMKQQRLKAILVEPYENRRTAETVAAATGATIVDAAQFPGGMKGVDPGYIPLLDALVRSLAKALAGGEGK